MKPMIVIMGMVLTLSAQAVTWGDFLRGHWLTDCKRIGRTYQQTGYTFSDFSGPEFAMVHRGVAEYLDPKCTKLVSYGQVLGHLNLKALVATQTPTPTEPPPQKGAKIRIQISPLIQYPYAYYDPEVVDELNRKAYCGRTDWQVGRAKDALLTSCGPEVRDYYALNWFSLEVTDAEHLRIADKSGVREDLHRWAFQPKGPSPVEPLKAPGR